jgi:2-hydroxychromene-2-carboxylate isomerase
VTASAGPRTKSPLEFWFDFASTYSYVGAMRIEKLCSDAGVELQWKPFLLGPVFALQGLSDSPFNVYPERGRYMWRELERVCRKYGLRWKKPSVFPRRSSKAGKIAAVNVTQPWMGQFVRAVFAANFVRDVDIDDDEVIAAILSDLRQDPHVVIEEALGPHGAALRENTTAAIAAGIFGAPTCRIGSELFWGEEYVDDAVAWAAGTYP